MSVRSRLILSPPGGGAWSMSKFMHNESAISNPPMGEVFHKRLKRTGMGPLQPRIGMPQSRGKYKASFPPLLQAPFSPPKDGKYRVTVSRVFRSQQVCMKLTARNAIVRIRTATLKTERRILVASWRSLCSKWAEFGDHPNGSGRQAGRAGYDAFAGQASQEAQKIVLVDITVGHIPCSLDVHALADCGQ